MQCLMGHGNEADFLGFLHTPVRHRFLTLRFEPFQFWLQILGDIHYQKNDSLTRRVGESTRLPIDKIFLKPLNKSSIIYSSRVLCLCVCEYVCVSQFVAEHSAILLVLAIKLTKETRWRVRRGRIEMER